jgi:hypothetical protein
MPLGRKMRSGGFGEANMVLAIEGIDLDAGSCHQGWRIDNFEPVVGEADDLLFAKYLQRPADVNVGKTESLANMALAQRQLYDLTRLGRKPAAYPHIDLKQETGDALPCASQAKVGEMIVRARLIAGDLAAQQNSEAWFAFDDRVQLTSWKSVDAHGRQATGGMVHRSARARLKPKYRAWKGEIQNLARAVVEQCRQGDPTAQDDIVSGSRWERPARPSPDRQSLPALF